MKFTSPRKNRGSNPQFDFANEFVKELIFCCCLDFSYMFHSVSHFNRCQTELITRPGSNASMQLEESAFFILVCSGQINRVELTKPNATATHLFFASSETYFHNVDRFYH